MVAETRTCHLCGAVVPAEEFCPTCTANFEHRRPVEEMTGEEREIEMRQHAGILEIPFELLHKRIEELVGRPVWTHEMGLNWEGLVAEASHQNHPTFQEIAELIPKEKRLIVNPEDPEDMIILRETLRQVAKRHRGTSRSFAELEQQRRVKPEVLVQTLDEYAHSGAAICACVVNELIHRVQRRLSRPQLKRLALAAMYGADDQSKRGFDTDATAYQQVLNLVQRKLAR